MENSDEVIFLLDDSDGLERVPMRPYDTEDFLQALIEKHPELLAGDQINPVEPLKWILVKIEAGVPGGDEQGNRWSVDHLLLDQNGVPTFVETKRSSDTRLRREIIGQMLDYAANAQRYWPADRMRSMAASQFREEHLNDATINLLGLDISNEDTADRIEEYWVKVESNLRAGRVRLVFVADQLPSELRRIIEFLNEQMENVEVLGVELAQYVGRNFRALVPRVIGQTEAIRDKKQISKPRPTDMKLFLEQIPDEFKEFFKETISESLGKGMEIYWGTKGFSLRIISSEDRPITLFYGYPPGAGGRPDAYIQGYVANILDRELRERIRRELLSIPGTTKSGDYTVTLDLREGVLEAAKAMREIIWETASQMVG